LLSNPEITVVHLVWGPLGPDYLQRFIDSYLEHPAGVAHDLVLAYNGIENAQQEAQLDRVVADVPHRKITLPEPVQDLPAYQEAAQQHPSQYYLFANSYCHVLVDGWLELLLKHARREDVGMVAPSGSYESMSTAAPWWLKPLRLIGFARFPNAHLRTGVFMLSNKMIESLDWPPVKTKQDAWKLENGRKGFSAQVAKRGLKLIVAGADGVGYEPPDWRASDTFRTGEQSNLVIADNRTDDYARGTPEEREFLAGYAWSGTAK
jgi:hypothetical protein